jgi:site-specific DNA recombinase
MSNNLSNKYAVAYIRVSSEDQVTNFSLSNQEDYCRKEAERRGYILEEIFRDEGKSAKNLNRAGLLETLEYCSKNRKRMSALFVYKIDRLSRNGEHFMALRSKLAGYGIEIISCTEPMDQSPMGNAMGSIVAIFAELDNAIKSQRTKDGLRKRFEAGLITRACPVGYKSITVNDKPFPIIDPEKGPLLKKAWDLMATGGFTLKSIAKEMNKMGLRIRYAKQERTFNIQSAGRVFRNPFYCGRLVSQYGTRKGVHEPLILLETFEKVQAIIDGRRTAPVATKHVIDREEFPLRRLLVCPDCGHELTGSFSRSGNGKKIPYYHCSNKDHKQRPSFPVSKVNNAFGDLLDNLTPTEEYLDIFLDCFNLQYSERYNTLKEAKDSSEREIREIDIQLLQAAKKNLEGTFTDEIFKSIKDELERKRVCLQISSSEATIQQYDIEAVLEYAKSILGNPRKAWGISSPDQRRVLFGSIFDEKLTWDNGGFSNYKISPMFRLISSPLEAKSLIGVANRDRTGNLLLHRQAL